MFKCLPYLLLTLSCHALDTHPWLGEVYGSSLKAQFAYQRFSKVQGAHKQLKSPLNDYDLIVDLGWTSASPFDVQAEIEGGRVNRGHGVFRSAALQARYQFLDDIAGDPISLTFGVNIRGVSGGFLRSVSTPYAAEFDVQLTCALGKEWSTGGTWLTRTYAWIALGQANRGYPWNEELLVWQYNLNDTHRFTLFGDAKIGFGGKGHIDVERFHGWSEVQHRSIDVGVGYGYHFEFYGVLTASYAYRVYAHNYPEHANLVMLEYCLPFSFF